MLPTCKTYKKMENVGDWLYIVIIVIAVISSIAGSFKKKVKENNQEQTTQTPREIFKGDIFDDDFWGKEQESPQPVVIPVAKPKIPQPQKYESKYKSLDSLVHQEGVSAIKHDGIVHLDSENEFTPITLEDMPTDTDSWRKAFIYSEVLNRKY